MSGDYPNEDAPWNFYFNGEIMPKWGACWGMAGVAKFLQLERDADQDIGHRDAYIIYCQIDHVGLTESADPDVFIYAVQEVLYILLSQQASILTELGEHFSEVYSGLIEAAFRMRELAEQHRHAFWISGYEADRAQLMEVARRCQLPPDSPDFMLPPHIQRLRSAVRNARDEQLRRLHRLAQSKQLDKDTRKRLYDIPAI